MLAGVYEALGRKADAIAWLRRGVNEQRDLWILELGVAPTWASLRSDSSFARILGSLNLSPR
jgi:hypothetical protein